MPRANHSRERLFAALAVRPLGRERADPFALGEPQRRLQRSIAGLRPCRLRLRRSDSGCAQGLGKPSLAKTAPLERRRSRHRKRGIVDIAQRGEPLD